MKKIMIALSLFISTSLYSENYIIKEIIRFNSNEKNSKSIFFSKKINSENVTYLLSAENKTSREFAKCKWETVISKIDLKNLIEALESINNASVIKSNAFDISVQKDKIKFKIKRTKCTSEHKTFYFQKSCKKDLNFVISLTIIPELIFALKESIEKNEFITNQS